MQSKDFLQAAIDVQNERAAEYDQPGGERSMGSTVVAFNAITGRELTEAEGWLFLQTLKDVRQWSAKGYHHDSAVDGVSYSALKAEALSAGFATGGEVGNSVYPPGESGLGFSVPAGDGCTFIQGDTVTRGGEAYTAYRGVAPPLECVEVLFESGVTAKGKPSEFTWNGLDSNGKILGYREAVEGQNPDASGEWKAGDRVRYTALRGNYFTNGARYKILRIESTRVIVGDDRGQEHPITPEFAAANFEWVSRA